MAEPQASDDVSRANTKNDPLGERSGRWSLREKQLAFFSTLVTLVTALLGVVSVTQKQGKDEAASTSRILQTQLDDRNRDIGNLRSNNNELQQKLAEANSDNQKLQTANSDLSQKLTTLQAATGASKGATGGTTSGVSDPEIRNKGVVALASGKGSIDLDASNSPDWHKSLYNYATNQLYVSGSNLSFTNTQMQKHEGEPATYATCSAVKTYDARSAIPLSELSVDSFLCGRITGSGRIAAMRVTGLDANSITLDITTWENR
jgi:hypothetical protein